MRALYAFMCLVSLLGALPAAAKLPSASTATTCDAIERDFTNLKPLMRAQAHRQKNPQLVAILGRTDDPWGVITSQVWAEVASMGWAEAGTILLPSRLPQLTLKVVLRMDINSPITQQFGWILLRDGISGCHGVKLNGFTKTRK